MALAIIYTRAALGIDSPLVAIEAHISAGLPALTLVGLPETTVKEARDRVRSAIINSGYEFPARRITINLAPADLPKEGGRYDLPIALALLAASEQLKSEYLDKYEFIGELALTGELRGVKGAISAAMASHGAKRGIVVAPGNEAEVGLIQSGECLIARHLVEVCAMLEGRVPLPQAQSISAPQSAASGDLKDVYGQEQAKRVLEIAATGGHNLLLLGPPGTGKTMLATRLNGILPPLTDSEALESAALLSLVNPHELSKKWRQRPFRAPHHNASINALVGGGAIPEPGEISLAHNGVLFLDELPEFQRQVLDALREPIESGTILISRTRAKISYPARFQLIAAMNPSPTGHYQGKHARSSPEQTLRYLSKLSGPFLDRFDLSMEVPLLPPGQLSNQQLTGETSAIVRDRVIARHLTQRLRQGVLNAQLTNQAVAKMCELKTKDAQWLENVFQELCLSVRAWQRLLKVARTIADMEGEEMIARHHLQEALGYRAMDRLLSYLHKMLP